MITLSLPSDLETRLIAAAARGVTGRVLVDGAGSSALPTGYWHELEKAGGAVHVFNPLTFRHFSLRNHRKLLRLAQQENSFRWKMIEQG